MAKTLRALGLAALACAAGCTDSRGRVNWGETALLGGGIGLAGALAGGAIADSANQGRRPYGGGYAPAYGYGGGYRAPYGGYGPSRYDSGTPPFSGFYSGGGYRCTAWGC